MVNARLRMDWVLLLTLGLSLAGNVLLGSSAYADYLARQKAARVQAGLQAGDRVPNLRAKALHDGSVVTVDVAQATVVYVMKSDCIWCQRNGDNFRTLTERSPYPVVLLALDQYPERAREYAAKFGPHLAGAYYDPDGSSLAAWALGATPQTIVVANGRVTQSWRGAYVGDSRHEIESFFRVQMPGLASIDSAAPSR
jgi:hypothetical protein